MRELELKLLIGEATAGHIWQRALEARLAAARPAARTIETTYFDTPGGRLRKAGVALRLRRDGDRHLQTVKFGASLRGGLSDLMECESELPGSGIDLAAIPDDDLREQVESLVGKAPLKRVSTTIVQRQEAGVASPGGTRAKLAVDVVQLKAGHSSAGFCELEIEHIEGPVAGLFEMAKTLLPGGGARFSVMSKAQRGVLLAQTGRFDPPAEVRKARPVSLKKNMTSEAAAIGILRECAAQIAANFDAVRQLSSIDGPHQLRIGLRRLRSSLLVFRPVIESPATRHLAAEARWLGQQAGRLRDLDVLVTDIISKEHEAHPDVVGLERLAEAAAMQKEEVRREVQTVLAGYRTQAFLIDLMSFVETRGWLDPQDSGQTARQARPVRQLAAQMLGKRWNKVCRHARNIETLSIDERHALRKELKKLRYAIEFFAPLFAGRKVKPFLARLKLLQEVFGDMNDAAMARALLLADGMVDLNDSKLAMAAGWVAGAMAARADDHWTQARRLWASLHGTPSFWK